MDVNKFKIIESLFTFDYIISPCPNRETEKDRKGKDMKVPLTCRASRDEHHSIGGDLDADPPNVGGDGSAGSWAVSALIEEICKILFDKIFQVQNGSFLHFLL